LSCFSFLFFNFGKGRKKAANGKRAGKWKAFFVFAEAFFVFAEDGKKAGKWTEKKQPGDRRVRLLDLWLSRASFSESLILSTEPAPFHPEEFG